MATAACTSLLGSTALGMKTQGVRQGSQGRGKLTQQRAAGEEGRSAAGQREKCTGRLAEKKEDRRQETESQALCSPSPGDLLPCSGWKTYREAVRDAAERRKGPAELAGECPFLDCL